jgi:hypothetical protein
MAARRKVCKAFHAGDAGVGRDTVVGEMRPRRGTGHFGTGTYFASSKDRLGVHAKGRPVKCLALGRAKLLHPETDDAAQGLFDALREANEAAARGEWDYDALYRGTVAVLPTLKGRHRAFESALGEAADAYADCRAGDSASCELDSASTRLVRAAGFDGVDVRGLPRFDNVTHGSVLYRRRR